jgi:rhodanese-related sulfurtransferase
MKTKQRPWLSNISLIYITFLLFTGCTGKKNAENNNEAGPLELPPAEFKSKLASSSDAVLIDVRKPEETAEGMIDGAINIDYTDSTFAEKIMELDRTRPYFVYCKSGKRTAGAVEQMEKLGFKNIYSLDGGYSKWQDEGLETVKP